MFVLDTNTLIYFFKGIGNVARRLFSQSPQEIAIPSIVVFELEVGIAKSVAPRKRTDQLNALLSTVRVLPFGVAEAKRAASLRVQLEKQGIPIGPFDLLICGTVLAHHATLVTHNTKEFRRIKNMPLEDWY